MTSRERKYPGEECGLSESEWVLEQLVDEIRDGSTLEGIGKMRQLLEYCTIETHKMTADWLLYYDKHRRITYKSFRVTRPRQNYPKGLDK